jgi:hypothetical protein
LLPFYGPQNCRCSKGVFLAAAAATLVRYTVGIAFMLGQMDAPEECGPPHSLDGLCMSNTTIAGNIMGVCCSEHSSVYFCGLR